MIRLTVYQDLKVTCTAPNRPSVNFETLKDVRAVEKHLLRLKPLLVSFQKLLSEISSAQGKFVREHSSSKHSKTVIQMALRDFRRETLAYSEHVSYLTKTAHSTTQSITDTLSLNFQVLAQEQNNMTFLLAQSAREDSVAIRSLTLVTSFYLPFSFVAVSLQECDSRLC